MIHYPTSPNQEFAVSLQTRVGEWSLANFGPQISKVNGDPMYSFAPLLGILEETLSETPFADNRQDQVDGVGDTCIYMCDFATREGDLDIQGVFTEYITRIKPYSEKYPVSTTLFSEEITKQEKFSISELCGKLCHIVLKHHQGIRKFAQRDYYVENRNLALCRIIEQIQMFYNLDFFATGELVFDKVVSKRNWKTNPVTGNEPCPEV